MTTITFENKQYIIGDYILENAPIYSKGSRGSRALIKNKDIASTKYIFARNTNDEWVVNDGKSVKYDKVFFKMSFIKKIPELNNSTTITDDKGIEKAPNIITLKDEEKFKDNDGNVIEIETRGERKHENIYFKVKDVMEGFKLENLYTIIIDKRVDGYIENKHYKYFICNILGSPQNKTSKNPDSKTNVKKELFLTYNGILRILFASSSKTADKFLYWAIETLFTVQMGTTQQKEELVANVMGVSARVIKEVFNTATNSLPCVYLFILNTVKNLRQIMNLDPKYSDDSFVCKYGFTKDLSRRTGEHIDTFKKIPNTELKLKYYSYMDPQYISKGESDIRLFMNGLKINTSYENMEELVVIPKELMPLVERQYEMIGRNYMGHISELVTRIKELEDKYEKELLNHKLEMQQLQHNNTLLENKLEMQKEKYEHDILKKEVEIMRMQMRMNS
jgi:AraC-like DNA-binding protein